jgi:hypothetical protein
MPRAISIDDLKGPYRAQAEAQLRRGKQPPGAGAVTKTEPSPEDRLNETERRCLRFLRSGRFGFSSIMPHAITLHLATNLKYTPDVLCMGQLKPVIVEIKGPFVYARALNKFKACVTIFPCFSFWLAQWKDGHWTITKKS